MFGGKGGGPADPPIEGERTIMNPDRDISTRRIYSRFHQSNLLRVFSLASGVSILVILILVGLGIFTIFNRYIVAEAEEDAVSISRAIIGHHLHEFIVRGPDGEPTLLVPPAAYHRLDRNLEDKLRHFGVLKIKIFSRDMNIVFSNDRSIIGESDPDNDRLARALAGEPSSELESKDELWDLDDEKKYDIDMVETYMPLRTETGRIAGAFEIYMDVSAYRQVLQDVLISSVVVILLVLLAVFGVLIFFMRKATRIIYSKSQEIRVLSGLLPICSACKKIRNDQDEWETLETFITERSESAFTHSLCPDCLKTYWDQ